MWFCRVSKSKKPQKMMFISDLYTQKKSKCGWNEEMRNIFFGKQNLQEESSLKAQISLEKRIVYSLLFFWTSSWCDCWERLSSEEFGKNRTKTEQVSLRIHLPILFFHENFSEIGTCRERKMKKESFMKWTVKEWKDWISAEWKAAKEKWFSLVNKWWDDAIFKATQKTV